MEGPTCCNGAGFLGTCKLIVPLWLVLDKRATRRGHGPSGGGQAPPSDGDGELWREQKEG